MEINLKDCIKVTMSQYSMFIYLEFRYDHLKSANIVIISEQCSEGLERFDRRVPGLKRDAHVDQSLDAVGPEQAEAPGDDCAPVVANQEDLVQAQGVKEANEVAHDVEDGVAGGRRRHIRVTVAAEVGGNGVVAGRGEGEHLVAPRVP